MQILHEIKCVDWAENSRKNSGYWIFETFREMMENLSDLFDKLLIDVIPIHKL